MGKKTEDFSTLWKGGIRAAVGGLGGILLLLFPATWLVRSGAVTGKRLPLLLYALVLVSSFTAQLFLGKGKGRGALIRAAVTDGIFALLLLTVAVCLPGSQREGLKICSLWWCLWWGIRRGVSPEITKRIPQTRDTGRNITNSNRSKEFT